MSLDVTLSGRWVTRTSGRGYPYSYIERPMPWIDPQYLECPVYLYPSEAAAQDGERIGGSGFLIGIPIAEPSDYTCVCVVTNKHVIKKGNMIVRVNTRAGGHDTIALDGAKWFEHPDGDDLVVCPISLSANHKVRYIPTSSFLIKSHIEGLNIGPGDEVFVVGRFINHEGKQRNLPSVRFGNISQMPWEPIVMADGFPQESFLIEAKSIAGYSGAPVFVYLPASPQQMGYNDPKTGRFTRIDSPGIAKSRQGLTFMLGPWLLGIDYCHIGSEESVWSRLTRKEVNDWFVKANTGMMGVIPVWKITDILEGPEMKKVIEQSENEARAAIAKSAGAVELDVSQPQTKAPQADPSDANPEHKEDFMSLLNAAAKGQSSKDQT